MRRPVAAASALALAFPLSAQESYWIANRASADLMRVTAWGSVVERVSMPSSLRSAHLAPDGKVWVVRYIQPTFDIFDPATATVTPVASTLGNPFDIAFDNQGNAWVSGGTGVQQFDANGTFLQAVPLSAASPLGITIDTMGNKWVAHRTSPPTVSRVDPGNNATAFVLTGTSMLPIRPVADFRGLLMPSHIWVNGDNSGDLVELDDQGNVLNVYPMPTNAIGGIGPVFDRNGDIWVGDFGNGSIHQVDAATGTVLNTYASPPSCNGLAVDSFGRLWSTARITFSGAGPPCEVRRIDPATGTLEVPALLQSGSFVGTGTQSGLATPWQYALVVDQIGDLDGDGEINAIEALNGTSPIDDCSNGNVSINGTGATSLGSTAAIEVAVGAGAFWLTALSFGSVPAGTGVTLPGVGCELLLDLTLVGGGPAGGVGPGALVIPIPAVPPSLAGLEVRAQTLGFTATPAFSNVTGLLTW